MNIKPIVALVCSLVVFSALAGVCTAFKPADVERVKAAYNCPGCDLSETDLTGVNLAYADLQKANLSKSKLTGVQLGQANLAGANLSDADLTGAKLNMTNLTGAKLTGAKLTEAHLYYAVIKGADFSKADLSDAMWVDGKKCKPGSMGECLK